VSVSEPPPSTTVEVVDDLPGEFAERVVDCFHYRPGERFRLALSGGAVAQRCYERLAHHAETQVDWWLVEVFTAQPDLVRRCLLDQVGAAHSVHVLSNPGDLIAEPAHDLRTRVDLLHLDLGPGGALSGPSAPVGADLVVVTASGPDCAAALARLAASPEVVAERVRARRVLVLADRAAAEPRPTADSY
jgi:Glucosamine-6-phosphate isomerases/6-phosphogluconolactonase